MLWKYSASKNSRKDIQQSTTVFFVILSVSKIIKDSITYLEVLDEVFLFLTSLCFTIREGLKQVIFITFRSDQAGGLSCTALSRPMRWLVSLSKLCTAQLRPHHYWMSKGLTPLERVKNHFFKPSLMWKVKAFLSTV